MSALAGQCADATAPSATLGQQPRAAVGHDEARADRALSREAGGEERGSVQQVRVQDDICTELLVQPQV